MSPMDAGLYPNAAEFVQDLLGRLARSEATPQRKSHAKRINYVTRRKRQLTRAHAQEQERKAIEKGSA